MRTHSFILASALLFSGCVAADAAGDNVILISVAKVAIPKKFPGACDVSGTVSQIFQGSAFRAGQMVTIKVPCDSGAPLLTPAVAVISGPDNVHTIAAPILEQSAQGFARLDDSGALIWQPSGNDFGRYGTAWGYRVMDGLKLPAG
jgi:hypothetical protein